MPTAAYTTLSMLFWAALGFWLAAQRYVGFGPEEAKWWAACGVGAALAALAFRGRRWPVRATLIGAGSLLAAEGVWRVFIHNDPDVFKPAAWALYQATPAIAALGLLVWWGAWRVAGARTLPGRVGPA